ncbi:MAG TPA: bifunctional DNA primase/polymerase [Rhizobacter sp.]|jgi:hypothetical protein|nr:bifunctional DNA primase/polymerase [Rhizobacter sp.]
MTRLDDALALAARGFWIFPVAPGAKTPAIADWPNAATRDPEQISTWWSSRDFNIGISTSRFGDSKAIVAVDVDNKGGKNGDASIIELEFQGCELPVSFEQSTPSNGRHILYIVDAPLKQGVNVLGAGLDIRSKGGYIVGPGSEIEGKRYARINGHDTLAAAPAWLVDRLGRAPVVDRDPVRVLGGVDAARAGSRAVAFLKTAPRSTEGDGGDITAFVTAAKLKDMGCTEDQALELMLDHWNEDCSPPWDDDDLATKVAHAYRYGREPQGSSAPEAVFNTAPAATDDADDGEDEHPVERLNREYAYVKKGAFILQETTDHRDEFATNHLSPDEFHGWFANKKMQVGDKSAALSKLWIVSADRREYEAVVFAPKQDRGPRWYNLWRGFSCQPAATAEHPMVERFIEHCRENVCGGDLKLAHWLLGFFAHIIQRPWEKPLVALVFKGKKGTGKNALIERIGALFKPHFFVADDERYLTGNFNSHLESCLLLVLDEASWAGDKRAEGKLKGLITGSAHNIERKGKEPYKVDNLTRVTIIGNEAWVVPATEDERRYAVFNVGEGRRQDRKYFHELRVGLDEKGGGAHLLRYLLDFDLATVDVNQAPMTEGLLEQKLASLEPMQKWWHDCLLEGQIAQGDFGGDWPETVLRQRFRDACLRWVKQHNISSRLPDDRTFGKLLKAMAPSIGSKQQRDSSGHKPWFYTLPSLEALRADWDAFIGHPENWEDS